MNRSYYIIAVNTKTQYNDLDTDIAFDAIDQGSPALIGNQFHGYDLTSFRLVIFKVNEINIINNEPQRIEFIPLVGFSGTNINPLEVRKNFELVKTGKLDSLGNEKKIRRVNSDKSGENKTNDEPSPGGNVGLPFGLPGGLFPFPGIPPFVFLILAGVSAIKFADTRSPVWAGASAYFFIHYRKNLKQ